MSERKEGFSWLNATKADEVIDLVGRLFEVAKPGAVFGTPMQVGDRTVFTASESSVSMGAGFGFGGGSGARKPRRANPALRARARAVAAVAADSVCRVRSPS